MPLRYAHPFEQVFSNYLSFIGYSTFAGMHPVVWGVWLTVRLFKTYDQHSGYALDAVYVYADVVQIRRVGITRCGKVSYLLSAYPKPEL